tara:strand:- start:69 stop:602 length:534 start_codon:yes stop_codon:yes gene_type:complete
MDLTHKREQVETSPPVRKEKEMETKKEPTVKKLLFSSEKASAVRLDFFRSMEDWITQELEANKENLAGLAVLLSDDVLHLTRMDAKLIEECPKLLKALQEAFTYASSQFEEMDKRLDKYHLEFQKESEDLEFRVLKEKDVFQGYIQSLAHSEEYYFISRNLKKTYDVLSEILNNAKD